MVLIMINFITISSNIVELRCMLCMYWQIQQWWISEHSSLHLIIAKCNFWGKKDKNRRQEQQSSTFIRINNSDVYLHMQNIEHVEMIVLIA